MRRLYRSRRSNLLIYTCIVALQTPVSYRIHTLHLYEFFFIIPASGAIHNPFAIVFERQIRLFMPYDLFVDLLIFPEFRIFDRQTVHLMLQLQSLRTQVDQLLIKPPLLFILQRLGHLFQTVIQTHSIRIIVMFYFHTKIRLYFQFVSSKSFISM